MSSLPRVAIAILAKQKETTLPLFLHALSALDYPEHRITLLIQTNNNRDRTELLLLEWLARNSAMYERVEFTAFDSSVKVENYKNHEWNADRFKVLGRLRQWTVDRAAELGCDYYFVVDCDNYLAPWTLNVLVERRLPVVGPLLHRVTWPGMTDRYSNYHPEVTPDGYLRETPRYDEILNRASPGIHEVAVIHCCYLIARDVFGKVRYDDDSGRHEYVIFSDQLRRSSVPQYIDNTRVHGYLTLAHENEEQQLIPRAWDLWRTLAETTKK